MDNIRYWVTPEIFVLVDTGQWIFLLLINNLIAFSLYTYLIWLDLNLNLQTILINKYIYEKGPKDSEIYSKIRIYSNHNTKSYNKLFAKR